VNAAAISALEAELAAAKLALAAGVKAAAGADVKSAEVAGSRLNEAKVAAGADVKSAEYAGMKWIGALCDGVVSLYTNDEFESVTAEMFRERYPTMQQFWKDYPVYDNCYVQHV
jgi:hypothetical protein